MAKKVDATKWRKLDEKEIKTRQNKYYEVETPYYQRHRSRANGLSTGLTACGFCDQEHEVYILSFSGGGKRCGNCNAMMYSRTCWAEIKNVVGYEKN